MGNHPLLAAFGDIWNRLQSIISHPGQLIIFLGILVLLFLAFRWIKRNLNKTAAELLDGRTHETEV